MDLAEVKTGDEIDSYCGKCKLERVHNVVAMVDGKVAKVVCKMCGSQHRYKSMSAEPAKKASKAAAKPRAAGRKKASVKRVDPALQWEAAMAEKDLAGSRAYAVDGAFAEGEVIDHKQFGHGLVIQVAASGKMEVLFKDGPKRMICQPVSQPVG